MCVCVCGIGGIGGIGGVGGVGGVGGIVVVLVALAGTLLVPCRPPPHFHPHPHPCPTQHRGFCDAPLLPAFQRISGGGG